MPRKPQGETPLYVKLPTSSVENLRRAAEQMGVTKKDLVTKLVAKYVNPGGPGSQPGTLGTYSFAPYDAPEVMNPAQAGELLQIAEREVIELAEAGKLPGKKLGSVWRFSKQALVAFLSTP